MSAARPAATRTPSATWKDACRLFGRREGVGDDVLAALDAFSSPQPRGGPPPVPESPWAGDFAGLEAAWAEAVDVADLTRRLAAEADGRQPSTFARRTAATEGMLRDLGTPAARILRVGLRVRLRGILEVPPPRLRRVRALADFYYSHAAQLTHPAWADAPRRLRELVAGTAWRAVVPGLEHAKLDGLAAGMPVHVNVLRLDPRRIHVRVRDLGPLTWAGRSFAEAVGPRVVAAVSGGFFLYSEDDIAPPSRRHDPVGLLLCDGVVQGPPVFRRAALLASAAGDVAIRRVGLEDVRVEAAGRPLRWRSVVHRARAEQGPDEPSIAVVGQRVVAVGRRLAVPLVGFVAVLEGGVPPTLRVGTRLAYGVPDVVPGIPACDGVTGGPLLLREGQAVLDMRAEDFWGSAPPITFSQDETGDQNLLARMVAGLDAAGRLLVAAVDGRNVERALGMTLGDTARLMAHLGCHTAMNLDGGSSKRMLLEGRIVDLPSTEIVRGESAAIRIRPVHSAVLFEPRA